MVRIDKKVYTLGEPRIQDYDNLTEKKFDLHGKIWVIKMILNDTIDSFMLDIFCNASITHKTKGHLDLIDCLYIKKDSWNYTGFIVASFRFIPTIIPPTYLHYHNNFFSFTKDKLNISFQEGLISAIKITSTFHSLKKGVYYFILGFQAFTINNSFYTVERYIKFLYPKNCNIRFETYKQSDPIGVSFSEMNASYINLYEGIPSSYCFFKNGAHLFKPKHSLFLQFTPPIYLPIYKRGYFDITIGDQQYIANKWNGKTHGDEFPWWVITSDKPLPVNISYSEIGEKSSPLNLIAFDVELP